MTAITTANYLTRMRVISCALITVSGCQSTTLTHTASTSMQTAKPAPARATSAAATNTNHTPLLPAVRALLAQAETAQQKQAFDEASAALERAHRLAPTEWQVYARLASLRVQQHRPAEAEQLLRKGLTFATTVEAQQNLWRGLAAAYFAQQNVAAAQAALRKAQTLAMP